MSCLFKIHEMYVDLNKTEKKIADYFINMRDDATGQTIDEISLMTKTSKASIVRFCKMLGYKGYRDFMLHFSASNISNKTDSMPYSDIRPGDSASVIMHNVFNSSKQSIDQTLLVIDEYEVSKAVNLMRRANRIDFFGVGACSVIAQDAQQKFMRINKLSYAFSDSHLQATVTATLNAEDVLVIISYSGETLDTLKIAMLAKSYNAKIISITKYGENSINKIADIKLYVSSPESPIRSAATGSRIAQLCLIDVLYTGVVSLDFEASKDYLDKTRDALRTFNMKV